MTPHHYHDHRDGTELVWVVVCVLVLMALVMGCVLAIAEAY